MTDKSLGQIAYTKLMTLQGNLATYPWDSMLPDGQARWQAAAEAVQRHVMLNERCMHSAVRDAVIKAAKELVHGVEEKAWYPNIDGLRAAVCALEAAEKGGE